MPRAIIIVLDSVGIGSAPDAALYGDAGANTVGHIAEACLNGTADKSPLREGPLHIPNLVRLGLGRACELASGRVPPSLEDHGIAEAAYGYADELSLGKDTPSGHWEIAGLPVIFDWGKFPREIPCFPSTLIEELVTQADLPGVLGSKHASGTDIIAELGEAHVRTGAPICYTSADSVFQIAAHEEAFGLDRLYAVCKIARRLTNPLRIGRVIARPFIGNSAADFRRTGNRRDYSVKPPGETILTLASLLSRDVRTVGKIGDIFAHCGTGRECKADGNDALLETTLGELDTLSDGGLLMTNLIDFDTRYGHRRDVSGYAAALESFDERLPDLLNRLGKDDMLILTADHGCDPTWPGTDHTRERIPILALSDRLRSKSIGGRPTFADIASTVARHLELPPLPVGRPFI